MWLQDLVAKFGPVTERADNTTVLDFERPLAELDSRIREVRFSASCFQLRWSFVLAARENRCRSVSRSHIGLPLP